MFRKIDDWIADKIVSAAYHYAYDLTGMRVGTAMRIPLLVIVVLSELTFTALIVAPFIFINTEYFNRLQGNTIQFNVTTQWLRWILMPFRLTAMVVLPYGWTVFPDFAWWHPITFTCAMTIMYLSCIQVRERDDSRFKQRKFAGSTT